MILVRKILCVFYLFYLVLLSSCHIGGRKAILQEIVDGDTLIVKTFQGESLRLRLLGIDCPELAQEPWGIRAKEFLEAKLDLGEELKIETDLYPKDKYGRVLAYVYQTHPDNNKFEKISLNQALLSSGLAKLFIIGDNDKYAKQFKIAEAKARRLQLNIWDPNKGLKMSPYNFRRKQKRLAKKKSRRRR